ncbi:hypothetical protein [Streptomyces sp. NPDC050564]|uniref:hypothetical protein n=1 Tax=Streptomyces sp. NPDC050564 TaxID=3365631 RepID=UPI0037BC8C0D
MLSLFRSRLIEHGLEQTTLELVLERLRGLDLLKAGGRQRTDSTHVLAAVRTLNRMEFVGETAGRAGSPVRRGPDMAVRPGHGRVG